MDDQPGNSSHKAGMKISERLPARKDWLRLFMVVSVPVHMWAWLVFFYDLPAYMLRLSIWQVFGVLAYVLMFALFESIAATLILTLLVWLIPSRISYGKAHRTDGYSLQGSVFLLVGILVAAFIHLQRPLVTSLNLGVIVYLVMVGFVLFTSLAILIGLSLAIIRQSKVTERMLAIMDRLTILAVIYLILDGIAVCLTTLRLLTAVIS